MSDTVHSLREALAFYGNMQNWQDGGFTRTARNTMTLIMPTAMKDRGERARAALAAAPQPAPVDREALVEVIRDAIRPGICDTIAERAADALLARGLRLPGGETMAWAVVGEDKKINLHWLGENLAQMKVMVEEGERVVRVAIRVVEDSDDAA